ncbi:hypothetical protein [Clostridium sp.]|uniref:hypothetical protein n=1 Tax=Clostridium sp. TaxID=1506 RepID=UPI001D359A63|nr:hypothetical protein [Clostridium sp.]MBS5939634.1 hypothetical protein [Clostridium sp.]
MNIKNLILKNKRIAICLVVALGFGIAGGASNMPQADYNNLVVQKEQLDDKIIALDKQLEENKSKVDELQAKKDESDRIDKAEAERLAKEEADRLAREEAERFAQAEQNSNYYVSSGSNGGSVQEEAPIGTMVWLSATGEKYHSRNNCGRMNPSKARQVTLESARSQGFEACSKCY